MESTPGDDDQNSSSVATLQPASAESSYNFVGDVEFQRWIVATTIAVCIIAFVTGMALLLQSIWRWQQDSTKVKHLRHPGRGLLGVVACNSTLCHRYKELISSCADDARKSPCTGLSDFVCGEGVCYGRPIESLLRGLLRSLAADALAAWRLKSNKKWPAMNRAADLYEECRHSPLRSAKSPSAGDDVSVAELSPLLASNDSAAELATRLAARYQDGGFIWLDASSVHAQYKLRLQLKMNTQFLQNAPGQEASSSRCKRRSPLKPFEDSISRRNILTVMDHVNTLWKKAGNLSIYMPVSLAIGELDKYGLVSSILINELNQGGGAVFDKADLIEVANEALLPFLKELLQIRNIKAYLAWEFAQHIMACIVPIDLEEKALTNRCFDCVERVAGLAAHAPFLLTSHEPESLAETSFFLQQVKEFVASAVTEASWLPATQQENLIKRLFNLQFVRGIPARKDGMAQLSKYYAYLPNVTGSFANDYSAAARAAWNWSLRSTTHPFTLLSAFPNVLVRNNTVFVPAVVLVPPLFNYSDVQSAQYSFFSVALLRAVLHSSGLTGLQSTVVPDEITQRAGILGLCLGLNASARNYSSRLGDVMAMSTALRVFGVGKEDDVVLDSCLFMCTADNPRRCDMPAGQAARFESVFACSRPSPMTEFRKCFMW